MTACGEEEGGSSPVRSTDTHQSHVGSLQLEERSRLRAAIFYGDSLREKHLKTHPQKDTLNSQSDEKPSGDAKHAATEVKGLGSSVSKISMQRKAMAPGGKVGQSN